MEGTGASLRRLIAAALLAAAPALADAPPDCALMKVAETPARLTPLNQLRIAVTMNGTPTEMVLDTGASYSFVTSDAVRRLGLPVRPTSGKVGSVSGGFDARLARVAELRFGNAPSRDRDFLVLPAQAAGVGALEAGLFGADYLRNYAVELDPAHGKVGLFDKQHCPGRVVYWDRSWYTLPFSLTDDGHVRLEVTVDGQPVGAVLDTGAAFTAMRLGYAKSRYDLSQATLEAEYAGPAAGMGGKLDRYRHRFGLVDLGGIELRNWAVDLLGGGPAATPWGGDANMLIGMDVISRFRMMIDYGERKIYFTWASEGS